MGMMAPLLREWPRPTCPHPEKRAFADQDTAEIALERMLRHPVADRPGHLPQRVYRCECWSWHFTSWGPQ